MGESYAPYVPHDNSQAMHDGLERYGTKKLCDDIEYLMGNVWNVDSAIFMGHGMAKNCLTDLVLPLTSSHKIDWGAFLSWRFLLFYPKRVRAYVAVSGMYYYLHPNESCTPLICNSTYTSTLC